ncbi:MAG TPA: UDP-2,3-diacylglucosamine diphosphatase [Casimicrobiaceae bacterium]|nr:UDP-2,3-diacylglucosamine diphosphatase [Casimicrobiaceae bacterium]
MPPRLFLSDLHLAPERPEATAAFVAFCEGPARAAAAVYILGDLFDWWIGDDQLNDPYFAKIGEAIRGITQAGVPVCVAHGNRDFVLGPRFAAATGATILPEQHLIDAEGTPVLVSHGDELCTGDIEYQRYRTRMRDPATQQRLLRLPYFVRRGIARWLRHKSATATALKAESIMDVDDDAVREAFRKFDVSRMIHGHTHRPATHRIDVDGRSCERVVLADWDDRGHYVELDGEAVWRREIRA